jgi:radical SAM superfamily enzyme YgiQ (UPF0313 family)
MALLMTAINLYSKFNIVIIDQRVDKDWKSRLVALLEQDPVCIGITAMTGKQISGGLYASKMAKNKNCPVVWGGIHASILPAQTIAHPYIDYVVEGEGEESFAELVDALITKKTCEGIPGVWSKANREIVSGGKRKFIELNKLSQIPYHLVDMKKYLKVGPYGKTAVLFTSRGCPQRCAFCFNFCLSGGRWRAFNSDRVLEDIEFFRKKYSNIEHFEFWDDDFFVDIKRAKEIAERIKQLSPRVSWSVLGLHMRDASRMDNSYLACLRDSNLKEVLIGVESGSQRILDVIQKNFTVEEIFKTNKRLGEYGIRPTYSFISGIPGEEDKDIKKTVEVMFKLKKDNPNIILGNIKPLICYPGTKFYDGMVSRGFNPPSYLEGWSEYVWSNYMDLDMPWVSSRRRRFLCWLYYYTILMNPFYMFIRSRMFTAVALILRPIAEWRVRSLCFCFPVEAWFMYLIQRFIL